MFPFLTDDDGYTEEAYFEAGEDGRPAMRIYFRPTDGDYRSRILDQIENKSEVATFKILSESIASRIIRWEFLDDKGDVITEMKHHGKMVPIPEPTADVIRGTRDPNLWSRLRNVIHYGVANGDLDPFRKANDSRTPADKVEQNRGNSGKG